MLSSNDPVFQEVVRIASGLGIFDCIPCARAIKEFRSTAKDGNRGAMSTKSSPTHFNRDSQ